MSIHIQVALPSPSTHLYHVSIILDELSQETTFVDLSMPVWIPGSYLVREYARHVQNMRADDTTGGALEVVQQDKATWRVHTGGAAEVVVHYEVYAHDINVRANHLDASHGFFNGVSLLMYPHGRLQEPVDLSIDAPEGWRIFTGLPRDEEIPTLFHASDFDELFDCPVEMGPHEPLQFEVEGVPHDIVFWGDPKVDRDVLVEDHRKIVQAHADLFGDLPYDHYTFVTLLAQGGRGGLEHRNSTILYWDPMNFRSGAPGSEHKDGMPHGPYLDYLRLVCHEHFHTWNVKRIRPSVLGPFDYQNENYTRDLWTVEGVTSYYEVLSLVRAGLMSPKDFLQNTADAIKVLRAIPGRRLHSLEDASFNAWVKLYRPDENTRNSSVSYYLKGELVTFLLDALIRAGSKGAKSFDDVMQWLWAAYQSDGKGYPEGGYAEVIRQATGVDVSESLRALVATTDELPWDEVLPQVALKLRATHKDEPGAWLGVRTSAKQGRAVIAAVTSGGPAHTYGLNAQDELVALDGHRITPENLDKLVGLCHPIQAVQVHVFRRGELMEHRVTLAPAPEDTYTIEVDAQASDEAKAVLQAWLGLAHEDDASKRNT